MRFGIGGRSSFEKFFAFSIPDGITVVTTGGAILIGFETVVTTVITGRFRVGDWGNRVGGEVMPVGCSRVSCIELGLVDGPLLAGESEDKRDEPAGDAVTLDP